MFAFVKEFGVPTPNIEESVKRKILHLFDDKMNIRHIFISPRKMLDLFEVPISEGGDVVVWESVLFFLKRLVS